MIGARVKVGIISAINAQKSKINWGASPVDAYVRFLRSTGAEFDYVGYEATLGQLPETPEECDAYVITGSPSGAYDSDPWIVALREFIREGAAAGCKFVGICFGHQILAQALGGEVQKANVGWGLGLKRQAVIAQKPWMKGQQEKMDLYFAHQDQVIVLPPGAELLGGSDFCPIGMYAIDEQILGIQGHPEFTERHIRDVIVQRELHGFQDEAQAAEASLQYGQPDGEMVAKWIVNFLSLNEGEQ